jgi:hypothetical protein
MEEKKLFKLKVRKLKRFIFLKHRQALNSLSDPTVIITTTVTALEI